MRISRVLALGASALVLLGACSTGGDSATPLPTATQAQTTLPATTAPATSGPAVSTTLVLGGPPECPQRPFCLKGLQDVYGLKFADFKALDAGGPITVEALKGGQVQVGLLFTSDPAIATNGFVLLQDDKHLQLADNLIPVVRTKILDASPEVGGLLNAVVAKLSQTELTKLNKAVTVDGVDPAVAAKDWLTTNGLLPGNRPRSWASPTHRDEQEILGELFAQTLEANGYQVERKFQLGNREIVFPALESGQIDVLAEYAATALEFVNGGAGEASTDPVATAAKLRERIAPKGLTALNPAPATDQNGFVVTAETAAKYGLVSISDLAKPAP